MLHLPNSTGRFHLYSDTSNFASGSTLYQTQNGKPKLIAYTSKGLTEAVRNYSITELELCGLAINIATFSHLLKRVDFDAIVDHLAPTHIIKSKAEPATTLQVKPRIGQGRAGSRQKKLTINQLIAQSAENLQIIPELPKIQKEVINMSNFTTPVQSISNPSTEAINRRMMQKISKDIPFCHGPVY